MSKAIAPEELEDKIKETYGFIYSNLVAKELDLTPESHNDLIDISSAIVMTDLSNTDFLEHIRKHYPERGLGHIGDEITDEHFDEIYEDKLRLYNACHKNFQAIIKREPHVTDVLRDALDEVTNEHGSELAIKCSWNLKKEEYAQLTSMRKAKEPELDAGELQLLYVNNPKKYEKYYNEAILHTPAGHSPASKVSHKKGIKESERRVNFRESITVQDYVKGSTHASHYSETAKEAPLEGVFDHEINDNINLMKNSLKHTLNENYVDAEKMASTIDILSSNIVMLSYSDKTLIRYMRNVYHESMGKDKKTIFDEVTKDIEYDDYKNNSDHKNDMIKETKDILSELAESKAGMIVRHCLESTLNNDKNLKNFDIFKEDFGLNIRRHPGAEDEMIVPSVDHSRVPGKPILKHATAIRGALGSLNGTHASTSSENIHASEAPAAGGAGRPTSSTRGSR